MARLVIAGAGGLGRELLDWVETSRQWSTRHDIETVAYLADTPPERPVRAPVISSIVDYRPAAGDLVMVAIGDPLGRRQVVARLTAASASFARFVHDSVVVGTDLDLPDGTMLCPGVVVGNGAVLGTQVIVNANSYVGHDASIGDFSTVSPGCSIGGAVSIGSDCLIGIGVSLRPHAQVGSGSTIGAGSTVIASIPPGAIAFGTPATVR